MKYRVFRMVPHTQLLGWASAKDRPHTDVATAEEARAVCLTTGEDREGLCHIHRIDDMRRICSASWSPRSGISWSKYCKI